MRRLLVILALTLCACDDGADSDAGVDAGASDAGEPHVPMAFEPTDETRAYCQGDDDAIEARITDLLGQMTLADKADLMAGAAVAIIDNSWRVPGNEALGIPGLRMLDGPRGLSRFSNFNGTAFPVGMMRGATWDPALEERVGAAMAREIRSVGADVLLAPTINILRHPRWGRAQETYSEDPHHMAELGVAFVRGVQGEGVIASAKHFAVNSIDDTRHEVDVRLEERTLREVYLPHFRRVVQEGQVGSVMSAYNRVNGDYCDLNRHLLTDILKGGWGFSGFVESDWILGTHGDGESVAAGLDIEMPNDANFRFLRRAVQAGEITEHDIDASVRRILRAQLCFGLDTRERTPDDPSARETADHLALAREVARRGVVLLKNEADALPLDRAVQTNVVLLGRNVNEDNIGDEGSSRVQPSDVVTALEGLEAGAPGVTFTVIEGAITTADEATVSGADAVIVVTGLQAEDEGEADIGGGDRDDLALPADQVTLIQAAAALNDRVIVVLEGGAALLVEDFVDDVEALLMAFYPGSEGGHALAELLFGDTSPSGRLPFTWPRDEGDLPEFDNVAVQVTYDYLHGYRYQEEQGVAPRFPFGHGLGYTSFSLANLTVGAATYGPTDTITLEVEITNTGAVAGRHTVQAYVTASGSRVTRAPRDLRAFAQVELEPMQTQTVELSFPARDLGFWDDSAGAWEVEALSYELAVGSSAADLPLTAGFDIAAGP